MAWLGKPLIKILCGMRRVGKSSILVLLQEALIARGKQAETILHLNMELMEHSRISSAAKLNAFVKERFPSANMSNILLIDEVQEINDWERAVNSLHAELWCDIILTGSNARLFSGQLASLLSGRYVQIPVYGLSFAEYLEFRGIDPLKLASSVCESEFYLWLRWGGMPGLHHIDFSGDHADEALLGTEYLDSLLDTIILKDVVMRNNIRDPAFLAVLLRFACDNVGRLFSAKSISDWLKAQQQHVSIDTIQNYIHFLGDAQLIYSIPRADIQGKRLLAYREKLFIADLGLRHAMLGYRADDIASLLENVVFLELLRRRYIVHVGRSGDREVDFVAEKGHDKIYLQVCYLLSSTDTIEREFSALESVRDNHPKLVLSMDKSPFASRNGIRHLYLPTWLIECDYSP